MEQKLLSHNSKALAMIRQAAMEYSEAEYRFYTNGFIKFSQSKQAVFVEDIYIEPEFRGSPIASIILKDFHTYLKDNSIIYIYGYVMKGDRYTEKRLNTFKKWGLDIQDENSKYYTVGCLRHQLKGPSNGE